MIELTPEHAKLAGYFNLDNGTGKIRGVYLQGNDGMRPLFEQWLAPFRDEGVATISIRNTGGTDHLSFDAVGLPGFQFIQDPMDYSNVTHHSQVDTLDHVYAEDLSAGFGDHCDDRRAGRESSGDASAQTSAPARGEITGVGGRRDEIGARFEDLPAEDRGSAMVENLPIAPRAWKRP